MLSGAVTVASGGMYQLGHGVYHGLSHDAKVGIYHCIYHGMKGGIYQHICHDTKQGILHEFIPYIPSESKVYSIRYTVAYIFVYAMV
jgi:hypothetical protein